MSLKDRITQDMKDAMRAKDKPRLATVRLILAAIKQREVDERIELDDTQVNLVLDKMVKQRRDSINQFAKAGREDLIAIEAGELEIITHYLPAQLDEEEINALVDAALEQSGATTVKDMGKVMAILKPELQGKADLGAVSALIRAKLG